MKKLHGLYAITDAQLIASDKFALTIEQSLKGGASVIQYRDKSADNKKRLQQASALKVLCDQYNAYFIINDDIDLALAVDADGIHIGKDDTSLTAARKKLGQNKIIGVSCYNRFDLALQANEQGADYIAFGSFFASPTKPNAVKAELSLLSEAKQKLGIPICAIGGINLNNAPQLVLAGADMLAVISSLFAEQDTNLASEKFSQLFQ